jgi:NAD(P)H dehydrogenase (quinone)
MTIAITAASGQLGRLAIAALKARAPGQRIIAVARSPEKIADLGVETRAGDYTKPETLAKAFAGVDTLVLISSNDFNDRVGQHKAAIDAAKAAGVTQIIYTSILKGDASTLALAADHIGTETALKASGLAVTLLRNGWYTENFTGNLGGAIAAGAMIGSAGEGKIASAARADYAEAIAAVAANAAAHAGKTHELAGDTAHTMAEMAAEVSRLTGKTLPFNSLPADTYAGILQSFGLPAGFSAILADSDAQAAKGGLHDASQTLSRLIGRPTTPWQVTVAKALV